MSTYLNFDDLCRVFFVESAEYIKDKKFIGNQIGLKIRQVLREGCDINSFDFTSQELNVINLYNAAKSDNSPAATTFKENVDSILNVSGNTVNNIFYFIPTKDMNAFMEKMVSVKDPEINKNMYTCFRELYALGDSSGFSPIRVKLANMAWKAGVATSLDYVALIGSASMKNGLDGLIDDMCAAGRAEIQVVLSQKPVKAQKIERICKDIRDIAMISSIPQDKLNEIQNEFNSVLILNNANAKETKKTVTKKEKNVTEKKPVVEEKPIVEEKPVSEPETAKPSEEEKSEPKKTRTNVFKKVGGAIKYGAQAVVYGGAVVVYGVKGGFDLVGRGLDAFYDAFIGDIFKHHR